MRHVAAFLIALSLVALANSVRAEGLRLNPPLPSGRMIHDYVTSPDGRWVVYRLYVSATSTYELYSVPISGGTAVKLPGDLGANGSVAADYAVSQDSSRVVYRETKISGGSLSNIYSADISGNGVVRLNGQSPEGYPLYARGYFRITPDSATVVMSGSQTGNPGPGVYAIPLRGGAAIRLNGPPTPTGTIYGLRVSADSRTVVYCSDQEAEGIFNLYSAPIDGSALPIAIMAWSLTYADFLSWELGPDGRTVVFMADRDQQDYHYQYNLYGVPATGGAIVRLNESLGDYGSIREYRFSPDGRRVVYLSDDMYGDPCKLFSVSVEGGEVAALPAEPGGRMTINAWGISPDGGQVVFIADQIEQYRFDLYGIGITGQGRVLLSDPAAGDVTDFRFSPSSERVVFRTNREEDDSCTLYSVATAGGNPVRLNDARQAVDFSPFLFTAGGERVVYWALEGDPGVPGLYLVSARGGASKRVSDVAGWNYALGAGSRRLVHMRYNETMTGYDLYSVTLPPLDLTPLMLLLD